MDRTKQNEKVRRKSVGKCERGKRGEKEREEEEEGVVEGDFDIFISRRE